MYMYICIYIYIYIYINIYIYIYIYIYDCYSIFNDPKCSVGRIYIQTIKNEKITLCKYTAQSFMPYHIKLSNNGSLKTE